MRVHHRCDAFPASGPAELSVLSWNLLAETYYAEDGRRPSLDWQSVRLPALRRCLAQFAACDVLCFQEVDVAHAWDELSELMRSQGFAAVAQMRKKDFPVVNATFFKEGRFRLAWVEHRSRALLVGLLLPDGRDLAVANLHLEAGDGAKDEAQRRAQLASAVGRLRAQRPWCSVVAGDFNSPLDPGSPLAASLEGEGLARAPGTGPTYAVAGYADVLDHLWAGAGLEVRALLGSSRARLREVMAQGLPDAENPSDHLPVAALFAVAAPSREQVPAVVAPVAVDAGVRDEFLELTRLRLTSFGAGKKVARERRRLEAAFLAGLSEEAAADLQRWRAAASEAAAAALAVALRAALDTTKDAEGAQGRRLGREAPDPGGKRFDPGGAAGVFPAWGGV